MCNKNISKNDVNTFFIIIIISFWALSFHY